MAFINYVKGNKSQYNQGTYPDSIFLAVDKQEIIFQGVSYGTSKDLKAVDSISLNGTGYLSIHHHNGESEGFQLTKAMVGLDKVDNTADVDKPVSNAVNQLVNSTKNAIDNYTVNGKKISSNPTLGKADVGLSNVDNTKQVPYSEKGQAGGVVPLNEEGKIDSVYIDGQQSPVKGVDGTYTSSALPGSPTEGMFVWCSDDSKFREWTGSAWDVVDPKQDTLYNFRNNPPSGDTGRVNILFRWDGKAMAEVSSTISIGEVTGTAYDGGKGKENRDAINSLPGTLVSSVSRGTIDGDSITINVNRATKSGINYGSPAAQNFELPSATTSAAGLMSATDKAKLDTVDLSNYYTIAQVDGKIGTNVYTGANYISKETNLTEAVLQLDEEIKATNDNLALEHTNAEATYAKKTELGKKLDISTYTSDKATFALKSEIPDVSNFLTISNAQSTYLTKTDAKNTYQLKGNYLTSVSIATISDLNANWDALLKSAPSVHVTRWPNISEVGSRQDLIIKLNGGTTEGTNQFTYNVTARKSINITPSSIGAAASSHNHNASQVSGLSKVATSGSYNDLTNKPTIPSAYTLPKATTSTLGGIKVGDGLEITGDGTLNCIIDPGSGAVSWGNIQGKPAVFATNIASINDLNSGWDALLKAAPNIPSLNGYATQSWVTSQGFITSIPSEYVTDTELNAKGFLTKATADGYYQPKGNYLTSVSWSQISGKPTIPSVSAANNSGTIVLRIDSNTITVQSNKILFNGSTIMVIGAITTGEIDNLF